MVVDVLMEQDYFQPSFYRFNQDSLHLVKFIQQRKLGTSLNFLDVGSGCGVIGIELAVAFPKWQGSLLEAQGEFISFLEVNRKLFKVDHLTIIHSPVEAYRNQTFFDLIVFNPPYFFEGMGRPTADLARRRCRHIEELAFHKWLEICALKLKPGGSLCFCFRKDSLQHIDFSSFGLSLALKEVQGSVAFFHLLKKREST